MSHTSANGHYRIDTQFVRGAWARRVGAYGVAVYNVLVSYADNETGQAWPSHQTIAGHLGCSRRTVIRTIGVLERYNIIRRTGRANENGRRSNLYTLLPPDQWQRPDGELPAQPEPDPNPRDTQSRAGDSQALPGEPEALPPGDSLAPGRAAQTPAPGESLALPGAALSPDRAAHSLTPGDSPAPELDSLFLTNISPCSNEHGPGPPVNGSQKSKKRRTKTKDPPLEAHRTVTGRYPPRASEPLILSSRADLAFWQEVIRHWIACGWSPQNLKGMLDHYQERRLPTTRPAGGYRSNRRKGAHYEIYDGNDSTGGYRFATPADFGLPEEDDEGDEGADEVTCRLGRTQ